MAEHNPDMVPKRFRWKRLAAIFLSIAALVIAGFFLFQQPHNRDPIKVGVLHSLSGTMAISEQSVHDATLLAIEQINAKGGLLGRRLEPIIANGASSLDTFAKEAERLIVEEKVAVVFGCWTSASRKTVKPIFEKYHHLLFYPVQYEGLEQSPNIVYTGAAPNQQILPAVKWCRDHLGKRFFLVGSDYVFPRAAHAIIKDQVVALRGQIVGEEYLLLGSTAVDAVVGKILQAKPDVILNTINGDTNVAFFQKLRAAGVTSKQMPVMSFSIGENELRLMDLAKMSGDYAAWNYFQNIDTPENRAFVTAFKERFGPGRVTNDPMAAAYAGVFLWGEGVTEAKATEVEEVRKMLPKLTLAAPEGRIYLDAPTQHLWKTVRIGQIRPDGQFDIIWTSPRPIRPIPYPVYRSSADWDNFMQGLYQGWGRQWANPGK